MHSKDVHKQLVWTSLSSYGYLCFIQAGFFVLSYFGQVYVNKVNLTKGKSIANLKKL